MEQTQLLTDDDAQMRRALSMLDEWICDEPSGSEVGFQQEEAGIGAGECASTSTSTSSSLAEASMSGAAPFPDLKKIIVKKQIMEKAVEQLGGGRQGALQLWRLVQVWLRHRGNGIGEALLLPASSSSALGNNVTLQQLVPLPPQHPPLDCSALQQQPPAVLNSLDEVGSRHLNCAATRAARKKRILEQRKSSAQKRSHACARASETSALGDPGLSRSLHDSRGGSRRSLVLLIRKDLRPSDVGNLGRIILPKKEAEAHLPALSSREGVTLPMEDMLTCQMWHFKYRFWPNNKSRMYLLENTGDFTKYYGLQEGDSILLYRDATSRKYVIHGRKNPGKPMSTSTSISSAPDAPGYLEQEGMEAMAGSVAAPLSCLSTLDRFPSLEIEGDLMQEFLGGGG